MSGKIKESYKLIIFAALALAVVLNLSAIVAGIKSFLSITSSILIGGVLAFILNVPMKRIEKAIEKVGIKKFKRGIAIAATIVLVSFIMLISIFIIVPNLSETFSGLVSASGKFYTQVQDYIEKTKLIDSEISDTLIKQVKSFVSVDKLVSILSGITLNAGNIFSNFMSAFLAIFFMINFLAAKEHLQRIVLKLLKAFFPENTIKTLCYIGRVSVETYDKFMLGKLADAVIIGLMIMVSYKLFGLPYGVMVGILAGVLSFIPYVGSISAMLIGAVCIFVDSPVKALISLAVFEAMQLIEDNLIYPRIVGESVGLPPIFTLAAASIGGSLFGVIGMIFFTPIFAVIYRLVKEYTDKRLENQNTE